MEALCSLYFGMQRLKVKEAEDSKPTAHKQKGTQGKSGAGRDGAVGRHSPVPDFRSLHAAWESRLANTKAANKAKATKPEVSSCQTSKIRLSVTLACYEAASDAHEELAFPYTHLTRESTRCNPI